MFEFEVILDPFWGKTGIENCPVFNSHVVYSAHFCYPNEFPL